MIIIKIVNFFITVIDIITIDIGSAVLGSQKISSQTLTEREVYVPDTQESVKR